LLEFYILGQFVKRIFPSKYFNLLLGGHLLYVLADWLELFVQLDLFQNFQLYSSGILNFVNLFVFSYVLFEARDRAQVVLNFAV
jgi:hypothetical protein